MLPFSGMKPDIIEKLHSTAVMQKVMRCMCDHPTKHGLYDGWGTLEPWGIFYNPAHFKSLILECTTDTENIIWEGRNI